LWKIENYRTFLDARQALLASETNKRLAELLHGDTRWLEGLAKPAETKPAVTVMGGITSEAEEVELLALNEWVDDHGLPRGVLSYDYMAPDTGEQQAIFNLAWLSGLQEELSQPVVMLLNESADIIALASRAGFRCFTETEVFKCYVQKEVLAMEVSV
jgi:hypothetical protein